MAFCSSEEEGLGNDEDGDGGGSEDDIGVVEPRPFDVTSWKRARRVRSIVCIQGGQFEVGAKS